ncbi:helicase-related protein [Dyella jiangningensis]|uniref:helicase-related protein n=1 Tax=Dyella jiangningensis TaxID=1379159 RepID=UPI00240F6ACA|nr:helicase-related protein [Dyella jiangningensis]MDG2539819.1 helicase-related protein [Dyella jiangningensis]
MRTRTREWLRRFLHLGARAEKDGIPLRDVERQEDTVIRALDMLDERPGVVLADEVGMGKTYEAIGIAAATRHLNRRSRIVVVTPGPDLNNKWFGEFRRFGEMFDFGEEVVAASGLADFVDKVRKHPVVVAPVTMFRSGRGTGEQTYLLSLYFHWKELHGHTANAIMARFRDGTHGRFDVLKSKFLDAFTFEQLEPHLQAAFRRGRSGGAAGLDDLYEGGGLAAFESPDAVRAALYRARFVLTGKLMPMVDLLIVDEAHKLKNPGSLQTTAMRSVFRGRFRKSVFLTATPFQLAVSELREVFSLFGDAQGAPKDLHEEIERLLAAVAEYQLQYEAFQQTWLSMDPVMAAKFRWLYDNHSAILETTEDPSLQLVVKQVAALMSLKTKTIEPGFRKWMIRSLREEKRQYRQPLRETLRAEGASAFPFLIYERFIAELFRRQRQTHKAAVEINMASSYGAAQQGSILSTNAGMPAEAEVYRELLRGVLGDIESSAHDHPKISYAITDALNAADAGEKTLIFCSRIATLEQLRRELDGAWESRVLERWRRVYPESRATDIFDTHEDDDKRQRGIHSLLQARFHRPHDALYVVLRESGLRAVTALADWALARLSRVVEEANGILGGMRLGKTSAERVDYHVAKRCVEQAVARLVAASGEMPRSWSKALGSLLDKDDLVSNLDLLHDESERVYTDGEPPQWHITERITTVVIGLPGMLWERQAELLSHLSPALRARTVERLARYLTYKQVPFLADLLSEARAEGISVDPVESSVLLEFFPRFWESGSGRRWLEQLGTFLRYFLQRDARQQLEILDGPIKTGDFARHTRDGESRERLREAFNTPLYPMVLIANEVMQEGLDLHKHCRRVVHHDLAWNPAQIEQRIGRIDRLGSLTSRLRETSPTATLDVLYPVIRGTVDERLFRTVKTREKWLEFLLGAPPNFSEYSFSDEMPPPLPEKLSTDLAIDLGPQ